MRLIAFLASFAAVNNIIYFTPHLGIEYYALMLLLLCFLICKGRVSLSASGFLLIGSCGVSILMNDIPAYYHPWLRFFTFLSVAFLVGPFLYGKFMNESRINMLKTILWLEVAIIILSAFGILIGFSCSHGINLYDSYFCGITSHSMLMAIISGNTIIFLLYLFLINKEKSLLKHKIFLFMTIILALGQMFWAGSRSAFLATTAGTFILFFWMVTDRKNKNILLISLTFAFFLGIFSPLWLPKAQYLLNKNQGELYTLDLSSRQENWKEHWKSFTKSPIFGIGFASSSEDANVDTQTGHVESGSSYLTILETTGILGGISILFMFLTAFQSLLNMKRKSIKESGLLAALLIFFLIHMCAEGYVFAAGGFAFFLFWLLLGTTQAYESKSLEPVVLSHEKQ